MKKLLVVIALLCIISTVVPPVSAATSEPAQPLFVYINSVTAGLTINDTWGIANCSGSMVSCSATPVKVTVRLQQYKDGSWLTLKTWTGTGTTSCAASGQYAISSGYTYRVSVTGYVLNSEGVILESGNAKKTVSYP